MIEKPKIEAVGSLASWVMATVDHAPPPVDGAVLHRAGAGDAAELLVLQRCCWVSEAISNESLDIPALHESIDDVSRSVDEWTTWCVRLDGRLIASVRAHRAGDDWDIGRLMVAPDHAGRGLGSWLLAYAESEAPDDVNRVVLFTGAKSLRNIALYERAGFGSTSEPAPPGAVVMTKARG